MPTYKIFDASVRESVLGSLKAGNCMETACQQAGICRNTLLNWRTKGEDARLKRREHGPESLTDLEHAYATFFDEMETARAIGEDILVRRITHASGNDWRAAAWVLSRSYPDRWEKRQPTPPPIDYDRIADELERALRKG